MARRRGALRDHRVAVGGLPIYARMSIDPVPRDRLPVILVHGLVISSRYMVPLAQRMAAEFRVYAPDLPGFGNSGKPSRTLALPELADALAAWMAATGLEQAALVGNSLGCQILAELAVRHPQRVDRLALLGPTVDAAARTARQQIARTALNSRHEPRSLGWLSLVDYAKAGVPRAIQTFRYSLQDRIEAKLPCIAAPVLVVRGSRDAIVPQSWAEEVIRLLARGRLAIIPGAAHTVNYNAPLETARVLRPFLLAKIRRRAPRASAQSP